MNFHDFIRGDRDPIPATDDQDVSSDCFMGSLRLLQAPWSTTWCLQTPSQYLVPAPPQPIARHLPSTSTEPNVLAQPQVIPRRPPARQLSLSTGTPLCEVYCARYSKTNQVVSVPQGTPHYPAQVPTWNGKKTQKKSSKTFAMLQATFLSCQDSSVLGWVLHKLNYFQHRCMVYDTKCYISCNCHCLVLYQMIWLKNELIFYELYELCRVRYIFHRIALSSFIYLL